MLSASDDQQSRDQAEGLKRLRPSCLGDCSPFERCTKSGKSSIDEVPYDVFSESESDASDSFLFQTCSSCSCAELPHGVQADKNGRSYMEDRNTVKPNFLTLQHSGEHGDGAAVHLYGVYDGHGGDFTAAYCADHLHHNLQRSLAGVETHDIISDAALEAAVVEAFLATDVQLHAIGAAELNGSTAVVALVTPHSFVVGNCGDSRAVLSTGGEAVPLSVDHSPAREDEAARVTSAGGAVTFNNGYRVMGALTMSRAIGDHLLQRFGVIPTPDVVTQRRCGADELLLLASDGLWDALSNQEAVDVARLTVRRAEARGASREAAARIAASVLTRVAIQRGSQDNITVVVVDVRPQRAAAAVAGVTGAAADSGVGLADLRSSLTGS